MIKKKGGNGPAALVHSGLKVKAHIYILNDKVLCNSAVDTAPLPLCENLSFSMLYGADYLAL